MDLRVTDEEKKLRQEIRDFAKKELPDDWMPSMFLMEAEEKFEFDITKKLAQHHWIGRAWPKEYGGAGVSTVEDYIFADEASYWGIPNALHLSASIIGPSIIYFGNDEQKKKFLPLMLNGEPDGVFCLCYAEPQSGTDQANVKVMAKREGDEYVINGTKIFTSFAHRAKWGWMIARTDPQSERHHGLSILILDMKQPGVRIDPIIGMNGWHITNETHYINARTPVSYRVGEEGQGWTVLMGALNFERAMLGISGAHRHYLDELVTYARETKKNGTTLSKDPVVRNKMANAAVNAEVLYLLGLRIAWLQDQGLIPASEASTAKVFASEFGVDMCNMGMEVLGPYAYLRPGSKYAKLYGALEDDYNKIFVAKFGGGVNEVQRDIVAQFGLGMPKAPRGAR